MTNTVTKAELKESLAGQTDEIVGLLKEFMGQVDDRFNKIEEQQQKFEFKVNARFDHLDTQLSDFDIKLVKLTDTLDGFLKRLDQTGTEQAARDSQFERLLVWAHKVSEKTGIPLENL